MRRRRRPSKPQHRLNRQWEARPKEFGDWSDFQCTGVEGPWKIPVAVEISGTDRVRRVEIVYALAEGEKIQDVAARYAFLYARKFGRPTKIDEKDPALTMFDWTTGLPEGYYFRIVTKAKDVRSSKPVARMWIKVET